MIQDKILELLEEIVLIVRDDKLNLYLSRAPGVTVLKVSNYLKENKQHIRNKDEDFFQQNNFLAAYSEHWENITEKDKKKIWHNLKKIYNLVR